MQHFNGSCVPRQYWDWVSRYSANAQAVTVIYKLSSPSKLSRMHICSRTFIVQLDIGYFPCAGDQKRQNLKCDKKDGRESLIRKKLQVTSVLNILIRACRMPEYSKTEHTILGKYYK
jgi:hypothetical protein